MSNPILSLEKWFNVVNHGADEEDLYRGFCCEEAAELLESLSADEGTVSATQLSEAADELQDLGHELKGSNSDQIVAKDRNETLDAHLDSAWVHLGAALAMLGGSPARLEQAWNRLHYANIDGKRHEDGSFHRDSNGKIIKPEGWSPPNYADLLEASRADHS